jgi:hypothetical protein
VQRRRAVLQRHVLVGYVPGRARVPWKGQAVHDIEELLLGKL